MSPLGNLARPPASRSGSDHGSTPEPGLLAAFDFKAWGNSLDLETQTVRLSPEAGEKLRWSLASEPCRGAASK